jgi:hypothetical protein
MIIDTDGSLKVRTSEPSVEAGGKVFTHSFLAMCFCQRDLLEQMSTEINLAGRYQTLQASFGVAGNSPEPSPIQITVTKVDDNTTLLDESVTFQQVRDRTINVAGVQRIRFTFHGYLGAAYGVIGDPTAVPSPAG